MRYILAVVVVLLALVSFSARTTQAQSQPGCPEVRETLDAFRQVAQHSMNERGRLELSNAALIAQAERAIRENAALRAENEALKLKLGAK